MNHSREKLVSTGKLGAGTPSGKLAKLSQEEAFALATPLVAEAMQAVGQVGVPLLMAAVQSRPHFLARSAA